MAGSPRNLPRHTIFMYSTDYRPLGTFRSGANKRPSGTSNKISAENNYVFFSPLRMPQEPCFESTHHTQPTKGTSQPHIEAPPPCGRNPGGGGAKLSPAQSQDQPCLHTSTPPPSHNNSTQALPSSQGQDGGSGAKDQRASDLSGNFHPSTLQLIGRATIQRPP